MSGIGLGLLNFLSETFFFQSITKQKITNEISYKISQLRLWNQNVCIAHLIVDSKFPVEIHGLYLDFVKFTVGKVVSYT